MIRCRVNETGSAVTRRAGTGSGSPKSARTAERMAEVSELICSQEDKPGTSKSSHQIARQLSISVTRSISEYLGRDCKFT